ncbi:MAG: VCBS repeat-containing protein, partial [Deltaproteobacteria bacterium]|nr:VCBS repeat-containing protein [Deltaproteobacteria bacterium]
MKRATVCVLLCGCADLIGITDERQLSIVEIGVSAGTLEPAFDPAITDYDVVVGYGTGALDIHAEANDPEATIEIGGAQSVEGSLAVAVPIGDIVVDVVARTPSDVVVTYHVKVHRTDITIGFAAPRSVFTPAPGMISQLQAIDFDGDGNKDLGYATGFGDLGVMGNDGAAQFAPKSMYPFAGTRSFSARDLDGDAKPEMIVMAGQLWVARGLGDAVFDTAFGCGGVGNPGAFSFVHLDGDGISDLVVAEPNGR